MIISLGVIAYVYCRGNCARLWHRPEGSDFPDYDLESGSRTGHFPADIKSAVQYGKNLQAMVVAFNTVGAVSINRTHEILSSVFNIPLATSTINNMVTRCADSLKGTYEKIRLKMTTLGLIHCDETGTRVDGKNWWVHNASDRDYTVSEHQQKARSYRNG